MHIVNKQTKGRFEHYVTITANTHEWSYKTTGLTTTDDPKWFVALAISQTSRRYRDNALPIAAVAVHGMEIHIINRSRATTQGNQESTIIVSQK